MGPMGPESWATSAGTRRSMIGNKARDTKPEVAVRRILHAAGLRYRVNARPESDLRRTADLLFTRKRIAVFIDGCYWHGCPEHYTVPHANAAFWRAKLERNLERDAETTLLFESRGWIVMRFWTHEAPEQIATSVEVAIRSREHGDQVPNRRGSGGVGEPDAGVDVGIQSTFPQVEDP